MENSNWNYRENSSNKITERFKRNEKSSRIIPSNDISNVLNTEPSPPQRNFPNTNGNIFSPNENYLYNSYGSGNRDTNSLASITSILLDEHTFLNTTLNSQAVNGENLQRLYNSETMGTGSFLHDSNLTDTYQLSSNDPNSDSPEIPNNNFQTEQQENENPVVQVEESNLFDTNCTQQVNEPIDSRLAELVRGFFPADILGTNTVQHSTCNPQTNDDSIRHQYHQQQSEQINSYIDLGEEQNQAINEHSNQLKRPHKSIENQCQDDVAPPKRHRGEGQKDFTPIIQMLQQHIQQASCEKNPSHLNNQPSNVMLRIPTSVLQVNNLNNLNIANNQIQQTPSINNDPLTNSQYNQLMNEYITPRSTFTHIIAPIQQRIPAFTQSAPTFIPGINPNHMHLLQQNNFHFPYVNSADGRQYFISSSRYPQFFSYAVHPSRQSIPLDRIIRSNSMGDPYADGKHPKPVFSYSCLIAMALKNSDSGELPVNEIYKYMQDKFPYFKTAPEGWKNSVRHNLSLNKAFYKIIKQENQDKSQRKGCLWALKEEKQHLIEKEINKWLRKHPEAIRRSLHDANDFDDLFQNVEDSSEDSNDEESVTLDMDSIKNFLIEQQEEKFRKNNQIYMNSDFGEDNTPTTSHEGMQNSFTFESTPSNETNNNMNLPYQNPEIMGHNVNFNNLNHNSINEMPTNSHMSNTNANSNCSLNLSDLNQNIYRPEENSNNQINSEMRPQSNSEFVDFYLSHHQIPTYFPSNYYSIPSGGNADQVGTDNSQNQVSQPNTTITNQNIPTNEINFNLTEEQLNQIMELSNHIQNIPQATSIQDLLNGSTIFQNDNFNSSNYNTQEEKSNNNTDCDNIDLNDIFHSASSKRHPDP